ncbi:hypothetical protein E7Z59_06940 [Robertkochia marina]|uniref:Uncharacterized protein n=1 Tax=Robertkochia marina TaxID=1227945 RepID=A0A4S3LZ69_9FLAO|nr:DUF6090 family protein [Robertkochia marina]THD67392.1 hypothetical protein E7Z59_06940 [Robertkochia marina]TRZ43046.1 hypothetical protein D3A96_11245 [Robertkochia marina]
MIKYLKEIRQSLVVEGKAVKYLKYAIGEIVLVVIGILIALSINNWNERKKNEEETRNYLSSLIENLNDDISSIDRNILFNKTRLKGIFYILEHAGLNTQTFTEMEWIDVSENHSSNTLWKGPFPDTLNAAFTHLAFSTIGRGFGGISLNKSVINELYSTGSFSSIQSRELKTGISNYYSFLEQRLDGYAIEEHEEWANETTRYLRDQHGIFTLDVSDLEDPVDRLKNSKEAEYHLRYLALEINYHCIWALEAKEKALNLINSIRENN